MWDPKEILTVEDVAHYLSTSVRSVRQLIKAGKMPSFDVGGEPRVQAGALIGWVQSETQLKNLETLKKTLQDKKTWARALEDDPGLKAQLLQNDYAEGSFGSFLKAAIEETDAPLEATSTTRLQSGRTVETSSDTAVEQHFAPGESGRIAGFRPMRHVFVSYVRENEPIVERLCSDLREQGINVWRDRDAIRPGQRWQRAISEAIRNGAYFIACFSNEYSGRSRTYMNEELTVAVAELRTRHADTVWFIPVRLHECEVPRLGIGADEDLTHLQWVDLFPDWETCIRRLVDAITMERQRNLF